MILRDPVASGWVDRWLKSSTNKLARDVAARRAETRLRPQILCASERWHRARLVTGGAFVMRDILRSGDPGVRLATTSLAFRLLRVFWGRMR